MISAFSIQQFHVQMAGRYEHSWHRGRPCGLRDREERLFSKQIYIV
jgi:hypothetical protein